MTKRKISLALVFFGAIFVLAGCGSKKTVPGGPQGVKNQESSQEEKLPAATGNVDDAVNAVIDGAGSEKAQNLSDESDAKSVVDDSQEINNLTNTYDQNAL